MLRYSKNPSSLTARTIRAKYFNRKIFLSARVGHNPSYTWQSICLAKWVLELGELWRIGDGKSVKIWGDLWLPNQNGFKIWSPCFILEPTAPVNELMEPNSLNWNIELINEIFL